MAIRCLQFCSYKHNDAAVWYLQFCSYAYIYRKKGNRHDKGYSLFIIYLFVFLTETEFSSSKHSFNCSFSLKERAVIWWNSKEHSNWKEAWKGVPNKLSIENMKFCIWKTLHKLEWMNKQVNNFNRCYCWNFISGHQFLRLLQIILWVTFLFRSLVLALFRMGIFGAADRWEGGRAGKKVQLPYNLSHISYNNETCHSYTLPRKDPKNIWMTWHIPWVLLISAFFH